MLKKIIGIISIIFCISGIFILEKVRFSVSFPMQDYEYKILEI